MDINSIAGAAATNTAAQRSQPGISARAVQAAVESQPAATASQQQLPAEDKQPPIAEAVSSIQQFVQTIQRNLNFSLDDSTGRVVVKVTDGSSGEVIRQIPSEEALRLAESLEQARSLLFKAEA